METLTRKRIGEMPILRHFIKKLQFREILESYIKTHGNETVHAVDTLLVIVCNIACGRQPLYELAQWVEKLDARLLSSDKTTFIDLLFSDDRSGRAIDKLYLADIPSMLIDIALCVIETTQIDMSQFHNDSTTVKTCGKMPGKTSNGLYFTQGKSKDHRPDLKQIVYNLTISADGAIPIHYKTYPGNRTDDTVHIEVWNALCQIVGKNNFLYVADCKVCTQKQLHHIVDNGGRVVTLIPETWKEIGEFKETLRNTVKTKKRILRRSLYNSEVTKDTYYCYDGTYKTHTKKYPIHWIYTTEKKKRDRAAREKRLKKTEVELTELMGKLNLRDLKSKDNIKQRVDKICQKHGTEAFYRIDINEVKQQETKQIGKGRPGKNTKYETLISTIVTLSWLRQKDALDREKKVDGVFPLLCTDDKVTAKEALEAYKFQPRLEKRFYQLKSVHNIAPTFFKSTERVEAMMMLFYLALIIQAVIEREIRQQMEASHIEALPLYPEHRLSYHPTTAKIFEQFNDISHYEIIDRGQTIKVFRDELTDCQKEILRLLGMTEEDYFP